jgi:hypothetical protein
VVVVVVNAEAELSKSVTPKRRMKAFEESMMMT